MNLLESLSYHESFQTYKPLASCSPRQYSGLLRLGKLEAEIFVRTFLAKSVIIPRIIYCEPDAQRKQFAVFTIGMSFVKTHGNGAWSYPIFKKGSFSYFSMSYLLTKYYFSTSKLLIISKAIFKCTLKNVNQKRVSILIIIFASAIWYSIKRSFAKCYKKWEQRGNNDP